jgi:hypothetical protein
MPPESQCTRQCSPASLCVRWLIGGFLFIPIAGFASEIATWLGIVVGYCFIVLGAGSAIRMNRKVQLIPILFICFTLGMLVSWLAMIAIGSWYVFSDWTTGSG